MKIWLLRIFIVIMLIISYFTVFKQQPTYKVLDAVSPCELVLSSNHYKVPNLQCLDTYYSEYNKKLAKELNISEDKLFVLGNISKYWASNLMKGREVHINKNGEVVYLNQSYNVKATYSGFCFRNNKPISKEALDFRLNKIKIDKFVVLDLDTNKVYKIGSNESKNLKHFLVVRKSHLPKGYIKKFKKHFNKISKKFKKTKYIPPKVYEDKDIKVILSDFTENLVPNRSCNSAICKELLRNIDSSKTSIDMAIYGYSRVPDIEKSLQNAIARGVKVRLVYDSDANNGNIYEDTPILVKLIQSNKNDFSSKEVKSIMHNKFYIFDDKILITGSANLSHTDMSEFNTNSIIKIKNQEIIKAYHEEFEQMFSGKFHSAKVRVVKNNTDKISCYFSPKDKIIQNAILPKIEQAQKYIYMPVFILTDSRVSKALIDAKNRGVEIKIILDSLNAHSKYSKIKELRESGIEVKAESYAGKMHSKSILIDDKYTIIGSMNLTKSAENKNDENVIVIENSKLTKFYRKFFLYQWNRISKAWLTHIPRAEGKYSIGSCTDGIDNNYDDKTDKDDDGCK